VEAELDLGDRSEWIRVERDPTLCELHNRDVDILCEWPNFRKKSCVFVSLILIYFMFLFKLCSYLELDLTIEFRFLLIVPIIFLRSILSSLLIVRLSGPRRIALAPDLLFRSMKFLVIRHIWPPNRTYLA
jgi:hypothetical protein